MDNKRKTVWFKPSTRAFFKEAAHSSQSSFINWLHGYIYARYIYTYIAIGMGQHRVNRLVYPFLKILRSIQFQWNKFILHEKIQRKGNGIADTYHGKVIQLSSARKLVSVQQDIHLENLENIIPYPVARDIIIDHPDHIAVLDCPCRASREKHCFPLDVCMIIGEPFTSFVLEHHPNTSRKITRDEALQILEEEDARGHVHHAFFKDAMLNRFYAICNCCSCCCGAIHAHENGTPMLAASGYIAVIDHDICINCGVCTSFCQFHALSIVEGVSSIDLTLCMGCGVCVGKCDLHAISLLREPANGIPLEIDELLNKALAENQ